MMKRTSNNKEYQGIRFIQEIKGERPSKKKVKQRTNRKPSKKTLLKEALITLHEEIKKGNSSAAKAAIELLRKEEEANKVNGKQPIHIEIVYNILPEKPPNEPPFD